MVIPYGDSAWLELCQCADLLDEATLRALSPMVILAPHQDDETLGCGGLLARAAALDLWPRVVFLTDGSASHRGSITWPPARIAQTRRREGLDALGVLGVSEEQVFFLDWADGQPLEPFSAAYEASIDRLMAWVQPSQLKSLWAPRPGESHCDHQAAADFAADFTLRQGPFRRFDYLVWGWRDPKLSRLSTGERPWRLPCGDLSPQRRTALQAHLTQMSDLIADATEGFLIPPKLAALVERPDEVFIERP